MPSLARCSRHLFACALFSSALVLSAAALLVVIPASSQQSQSSAPNQSTPDWAYALNPPVASTSPGKNPPPDPTRLHVPDSSKSFTLAQTNNFFRVADWHPGSHPQMPAIVSAGRKPDVYACGYCHLPNGQGRPENASLAGLPAAYIIQQMSAFQSGARKTSEPRHLPAVTMSKVANAAKAAEVQSAAAYFSSLKPKPWIRVLETNSVPKTHVAGWMLVATAGAGAEPIGHRIIEIPENLERTELRDDASGFIAYVPVGSLAKGKILVTTGSSGHTLSCATCHGSDLRGRANIPSIAGRSPSYIVRQFLDMRSGARHGGTTVLMQPVIARLTLDDIIAISAYLASLHP
jgi:cytochrome c553